MTEKPDIPEWAMRAATDALNIDVWYEDGRSLLQESVALAIIKSRSQAFEGSAKIAEDYDGLGREPSEGAAYGDASLTQMDIAEQIRSQAIRQHSQKGRDTE